MAIFGSFTYGEDVYGEVADASYMDVLAHNLILLRFDADLVVDSAYLDPTNYAVEVVDGSGPVAVRRVLRVNDLVSEEVILVTDRMTLGTTYRVYTSASISARNGSPATTTGLITSRDTKVDSILRSLPKHFDKTPESTIASLLTAVARQDELIGGGRSDLFEYPIIAEVSTIPAAPVVEITSPVDASTVVTSVFDVEGTFSNADRIDVFVDDVKVGEASLNDPSAGLFVLTLPAQADLSTPTIRVVAVGDGGFIDTEISVTVDF